MKLLLNVAWDNFSKRRQRIPYELQSFRIRFHLKILFLTFSSLILIQISLNYPIKYMNIRIITVIGFTFKIRIITIEIITYHQSWSIDRLYNPRIGLVTFQTHGCSVSPSLETERGGKKKIGKKEGWWVVQGFVARKCDNSSVERMGINGMKKWNVLSRVINGEGRRVDFETWW